MYSRTANGWFTTLAYETLTESITASYLMIVFAVDFEKSLGDCHWLGRK